MLSLCIQNSYPTIPFKRQSHFLRYTDIQELKEWYYSPSFSSFSLPHFTLVAPENFCENADLTGAGTSLPDWPQPKKMKNRIPVKIKVFFSFALIFNCNKD
jgi:hypothetical protein